MTLQVTVVRNQLRNVLQSIDIGTVRIPNRIVLSPINTSFGDRVGNVTDRLVRFHTAISKGGVGLSVVGSTAISPEGRVNYFGLMLDTDSKIGSFRALFRAIEEAGSIPAIQLMHAGRQTFPYVSGEKVVAPSSIASPYFGTVPRALEVYEIESIAKKFASAASRAKIAGAKIIELHGAHGYLIGQFLSSLSNRRNDQYGGNLSNRTRFFCEIIHEIKRSLGSDFPVICRVSVTEYLHGGLTTKDSLKIAKMLAENGADCFSISAGIYGQKERIYPTKSRDQIIRFETARKIKNTSKIPVICGGRVANLFEAEKILDAGKADLIAMARALVADPNLMSKSISGHIRSILACKWCNKCVYDFRKFQRLRCVINPYL